MAEKKKNIFKRIAQKFRDVRLEMKKAVWPSKEKLKQISAVVLVVIVFFAIFLTFVGNGSKWILEKVEFYKQVEQTTVATTAVPTAATETTAAESDSETEASEDATETEATTTTSEETSSTAG